MRLLSSLNAPLDAEIELVGATPEELAQPQGADRLARDLCALRARFAGVPGQRHGQPQRTADGRDVIQLRSAETDHRAVPHAARRSELGPRARSSASTRMLLDPPVFAPGRPAERMRRLRRRPRVPARAKAPSIARRPARRRRRRAKPSRPRPSPLRHQPALASLVSAALGRCGRRLAPCAGRNAVGYRQRGRRRRHAQLARVDARHLSEQSGGLRRQHEHPALGRGAAHSRRLGRRSRSRPSEAGAEIRRQWTRLAR